jgi:cobalamin biosynthesis protein CobT
MSFRVNGIASKPRPDSARRLQAVIRSSKTGRRAPLTGVRAGRIDRTRVARLGCGDLRVFKVPHAPQPQKVRVLFLLDASGSMIGHEATITCQLMRDFADAISAMPDVTGEAWAHTTSYTNDGNGHSLVSIAPLWKKGQNTQNVNRYLRLSFTGNEDGWALAYVGDRLAETIQPGETGLIVVISDGAPAYSVNPTKTGPGRHSTYDHVRTVAENIRERGHGVISVSVSRMLNVQSQAGMYGKDSVVAYDSNMAVTARRIGLAIGKEFNK